VIWKIIPLGPEGTAYKGNVGHNRYIKIHRPLKYV
jgi:hypothetical protein